MTDTKHFSTTDEYIASFPAETQAVLQKIRQLVQDIAPEAEEKISYGIPAFRLHNTYVVYYSGWKTHISIYPQPHAADAALEKAIAPFATGKGTIQFALDKPIPYDLVERIVKALIRDSEARGTHA